MQLQQARPMPRRPLERRMARPVFEPRDRSLAGPRRRDDRPQRGLRRWVGPTALVALSFLGLVPLAGLGQTNSPAAPRPGSGLPGNPLGASPTVDSPITTTELAALATPRPTAVSPPVRPWPALPDTTIGPTPKPDPTSKPDPTPAPSPTPPAGRDPGLAPASAADFDRRGQVIDIGFPLAAGVRHRYRDNYGEYRPGPVEPYNHAFDERDGALRRAHDGIDIYAARATKVLSPFDGVVINPASRWQPWQRDRYGITVAIVSTEPASRGYTVLLSHLDERSVRIGAHVRRGRPVGTLGITGNAEDSPAQLHFELRAPFLIRWNEADRRRLVDAFDPYPSLRAADPALAN